MTQTEQLRNWIKSCSYIVFFGGAGTSTESGIPDFRSESGLYRQHYAYPPETILSHSFFLRHPAEFYRFYKDKMIYADAKPNPAHFALASLEARGKLQAVITQNIDGLHQAAGSREVLELHGSIFRNRCMDCQRQYPLESIQNSEGLPRCTCKGIIKPEVVLYEESLDSAIVERSIAHIQHADMLIIGGTSLSVYPAAAFIDYFRGNKLVLINRSRTAKDVKADLVIEDSLSKVLSQALDG